MDATVAPYPVRGGRRTTPGEFPLRRPGGKGRPVAHLGRGVGVRETVGRGVKRLPALDMPPHPFRMVRQLRRDAMRPGVLPPGEMPHLEAVGNSRNGYLHHGRIVRGISGG